MNQLQIALKTSGLRDEVRTKDEVLEIFGINPSQFPELFTVRASGYVSKTALHRNLSESYFRQIRFQNAMLTGRIS